MVSSQLLTPLLAASPSKDGHRGHLLCAGEPGVWERNQMNQLLNSFTELARK